MLFTLKELAIFVIKKSKSIFFLSISLLIKGSFS